MEEDGKYRFLGSVQASDGDGGHLVEVLHWHSDDWEIAGPPADPGYVVLRIVPNDGEEAEVRFTVTWANNLAARITRAAAIAAEAWEDPADADRELRRLTAEDGDSSDG